MAGPLPGIATGLLGGVAVTVAVSSSVTYEYDSGQAYFFEIWVSVTGNASSTAGVDITVKRKTGAGGTAASDGITLSLPATASGVVYMGIYDPGTVDVVVTNKDATYTVTLNEIYVRAAT